MSMDDLIPSKSRPEKRILGKSRLLEIPSRLRLSSPVLSLPPRRPTD